MKYIISLLILLSNLSSCSYQPVYHEINTSPAKETSEAIIIFYVNGLSLDGEVPLYIDGIQVGIVDKHNYVKTPISYGKHIFNTKCNIAMKMSYVCVAKQTEIEINKGVTYITYTAKNYPATFVLSINETAPISQFYGLE